MGYKNTDLQLPPVEDEGGVEKQQPRSSLVKQPPRGIVDITDDSENGRATRGFFEDYKDPEKPREKPGEETQKSSSGRIRALLVALGVVAAGAVYYHSGGGNGDSAKTEKPSADAKAKPEPQQPQQSKKPDEAAGVEYRCRFNYDASEKRVRAECDGVAAAALKIVFDADASTKENAIGKLLIDTDGDGEKDDVSCGLAISKPADRKKSQQLDIVGELECALVK